MTAPADALRHAPDAVAPGESFSARFSVSVSIDDLTVCKNAYRAGINGRTASRPYLPA